MRRSKRVRIHMISENLPSVEGLLVSKRGREFVVGLPALITNPQAAPSELTSRLLVIPRENVAFYEVTE